MKLDYKKVRPTKLIYLMKFKGYNMDRETYLTILMTLLKSYKADDEIGDDKKIELIKEIEKIKKDLTKDEN